MKNMPGAIIILHKSNKNHDYVLYCSWHKAHGGCNCSFSFWGICVLSLPEQPKKWKFQKNEKTTRDIIILKNCTKNYDYRLCCPEMTCDGYNYFSLWAIFFAFTPLTTRNMKNSTKMRKTLEISSFYTSVPKIMIICYTVPEKWHMIHVIFNFHFGLFFALSPPNSPKNQNFKKMKKLPGDIIILHMCTKNHNHKTQTLKNWQKHLEMPSF